MLRFDPDSPWEMGQLVIVSDDESGHEIMKTVVKIERSEDGYETQYELVSLPDTGEHHYIKPE